jgi:hypothetical protein
MYIITKNKASEEVSEKQNLWRNRYSGIRMMIVTDSMGKMCVDPGETLTALQAGGVRGPGLPVGKKGGQLASVSGKRRT